MSTQIYNFLRQCVVWLVVFFANFLNIRSLSEQKGRVVAAVDVIVVADNKVLLIKCGRDPHKGCWAFPGGKIEHEDSSIVTAALRELQEETGLELTRDDLTFVTAVGNNTRDARGFFLTNVFLARLDSIPEGIQAADDAVDHCWVDLEDLFPDPTWPDITRVEKYPMAFDHKDILFRALYK